MVSSGSSECGEMGVTVHPIAQSVRNALWVTGKEKSLLDG